MVLLPGDTPEEAPGDPPPHPPPHPHEAAAWQLKPQGERPLEPSAASFLFEDGQAGGEPPKGRLTGAWVPRMRAAADALAGANEPPAPAAGRSRDAPAASPCAPPAVYCIAESLDFKALDRLLSKRQPGAPKHYDSEGAG